MTHFYSESETLKALNITDFGQINSDNITEFAKMFKDIDPEVGKLALSMIPEFTKTIRAALDSYRESYNRSLEELGKMNDSYHDFCSRILDLLQSMTEQPDISTEERAQIIETLKDLEERRAAHDDAIIAANREARENHNKNVGHALLFTGSVVALLSGIIIGIGRRK